MKLKFIIGIVGCTLFGLSTVPLVTPALAQTAPRTCASRKSPTKGAPTLVQAKTYFICGAESTTSGLGASSHVSVVRNVKIEMSPKPIFLNAANIDSVREAITNSSSEVVTVDEKKPLYAIRGSLIRYTCFAHSPAKCLEYNIVNAQGFCYVDDFGDWNCKMKGNFGAEPRNNVSVPNES
jgi:hypothetical protein